MRINAINQTTTKAKVKAKVASRKLKIETKKEKANNKDKKTISTTFDLLIFIELFLLSKINICFVLPNLSCAYYFITFGQIFQPILKI